MANFNELIKYYRNQVTNQDPEDYEMSATHAAEELEGMASKYAEKADADMTMSIVLQAVAHYLDVQDDKFEKRRTRNAEQFINAEVHEDAEEVSAKPQPKKINKITLGGKTYEVGNNDPNDDGIIASIEKYSNGYFITGEVYRDYGDGDEPSEGYGYAVDLKGNKMEEEDLKDKEESWSTERAYISDIENYTGKDDIASADKTYVFKKDTGEVVVGGKSVDVYKWLLKNFDSEKDFYNSHELNNYAGVGPDFVPDRAKAKSENKISALSESFKQEITAGLKRTL